MTYFGYHVTCCASQCPPYTIFLGLQPIESRYPLVGQQAIARRVVRASSRSNPKPIKNKPGARPGLFFHKESDDDLLSHG